ncbi:MAG TPA: hypothetical protein VGC88_10550 [Terriglobales bacterium]|jgi:hypothetical protein
MNSLQRLASFVLILSAAACAQSFTAVTAADVHSQPTPDHVFPAKNDHVLLEWKKSMPLGCEAITIGKDKRRAAIMASIEAPDMDGVKVFTHDKQRYVIQRDGKVLQDLPSQITFRITASGLLDIADEAFPVESNASTDEFFKHLKFVARVFRNGDIDADIMQPMSLQNVGVPLDVPSDERVYRASFDFGKLSVNDHVVLLVNTDDGSPVAKFFMELK